MRRRDDFWLDSLPGRRSSCPLWPAGCPAVTRGRPHDRRGLPGKGVGRSGPDGLGCPSLRLHREGAAGGGHPRVSGNTSRGPRGEGTATTGKGLRCGLVARRAAAGLFSRSPGGGSGRSGRNRTGRWIPVPSGGHSARGRMALSQGPWRAGPNPAAQTRRTREVSACRPALRKGSLCGPSSRPVLSGPRLLLPCCRCC